MLTLYIHAQPTLTCSVLSLNLTKEYSSKDKTKIKTRGRMGVLSKSGTVHQSCVFYCTVHTNTADVTLTVLGRPLCDNG